MTENINNKVKEGNVNSVTEISTRNLPDPKYDPFINIIEQNIDKVIEKISDIERKDE